MDCLNARGFSMQENRNFFYTVHEYALPAADMGSFKDTGTPHGWNPAYTTATKLIVFGNKSPGKVTKQAPARSNFTQVKHHIC